MNYSITYDEIRDSLKVSGICEKCGKKRTRTISDFQTLNPYNKNKNGSPKTAFEIREELRNSILEKANKLREHFICATCWSELPWPKQWPKKDIEIPTLKQRERKKDDEESRADRKRMELQGYGPIERRI